MIVRTLLAASLALSVAAPAGAQDSVYIEELTWTEIRDAIKGGKTTVILPTGGTEQNGPHMVMGKHNFIIHHTAGEIAKKLGNALVGPVVAFVPEGNLDPPSGHMRFPGAITLPEEHYQKLLEYRAQLQGERLQGHRDDRRQRRQPEGDGGRRGHAQQGMGGHRVRVHFIPEYSSGRFSAYWRSRASRSSRLAATPASRTPRSCGS